jgi:NRAMP (natural resistance-associated macrophage protein)-like metal ion transporter
LEAVVSEQVVQEEAGGERPNRLKRLLMVVGPGLITGAAANDPAGIGTYALAGASFGFSTLWLVLLLFPLMTAVQFTCAKIGLVTGRGLAGNVRRHYPRWVLYVVVSGVVIANTLNAGADIGAIAAGINLLVPIPIPFIIVPIAILIPLILTLGQYEVIARIFRWLTLALLAYTITIFFAQPDAAEVLRGTFIPTLRFDSAFLATVLAILGTNISPYLFFWNTSQVVEEEKSQVKEEIGKERGEDAGEFDVPTSELKNASRSKVKATALDVKLGIGFANVVLYSIVLGTAATLFKTGNTNIQSATDAAQALRPVAGDVATLLFAVGIIGAGLLAVPVLCGSAAYAVSEAFGWRWGLDEKPYRAKQFYAVIAASALIGTLINFTPINPFEALFGVSVINGFLSPALLVIILLMANNRRVMGKRVNDWRTNLPAASAALVLASVVVALVLAWVL